MFTLGTHIASEYHQNIQNLWEYQLIGSFFPIGWIYSESSPSFLITFFLLADENYGIFFQFLISELGSLLAFEKWDGL